MLTVGIPRELKPLEKRVGLTPQGVRHLTQAGIPVLVEQGAGARSNFLDEDYEEAGARVVRDDELYLRSGLIQKVKDPLPSEWGRLGPETVLFSFLHLASPEHCDLVKALMERRLTALGFETVAKERHALLLKPMSEIAGSLAAYFAGYFRKGIKVEEGKIKYPPHWLEELEHLASHYPDPPENLPPGKVVVFGGGRVGSRATELLLKMGGQVDLIEKDPLRQTSLQTQFHSYGSRLWVGSTEEDVSERLREADVWMGCVSVLGERAPWVLSSEALQELSSGKPKLIVDVAADQGGNFPETHSTTYEDPLYLDSRGNLRFGVTNIPSLCGRGASEVMEKATRPYTLALARDWMGALREFPELQKGLQVFRGRLVSEAVARAHRLPWEAFRVEELE